MSPTPVSPVTPMLALASPGWLWLLVPVAALLALYLVTQGRRSSYAVRYATLPMLERLVPKRPAWRRHLPAALLLVAFVALAFAAARPQVDRDVPREHATVIVTVDVSLSMMATDVAPDRLTAAREAAKSFVQGLPDGFDIGVVAFSQSSQVLAAPTTDKQAALAALDRLTLAEGTNVEGGVTTSLAQIQAAEAAAGIPDSTGGGDSTEPVPAEIVLLSDGTQLDPVNVQNAITAAQDAGVPVSTIAYGTADGNVTIQGQTVPVPVDVRTLGSVADQTGGTAYTAESEGQLQQVYDDIKTSIGYTTEPKDITPYAVAAALLVGLLAAALSLRWFSRLP